MWQAILAIALAFLSVYLFLLSNLGSRVGGRLGRALPLSRRFLGVLAAIGGLILGTATSVTYIDAEDVGHLKRIYGSAELAKGRIIATAGQKGPQAEILGPGFHLIPLLHIIYDVERFPVVEVPQGSYAELTALDGQAMPTGMYIAPQFAAEREEAMLDANAFLAEKGYRGPQETVLKPGRYRLNRYLWKIDLRENQATVIPAGFVGVVKSNVRDLRTSCPAIGDDAPEPSPADLRAPLVPRGCIGIWREPLFPGAYYLNKRAYEVTLVDTRVQTWSYIGGYVKRRIDLVVDQDGKITQKESQQTVTTPQSAADRAVFIKLEGWDVPQELRVVVQVSPENAPKVVSSVGDLTAVENRIITPVIRSAVRNIAARSLTLEQAQEDGSTRLVERPVRVLDLIELRPAIEDLIEDEIKAEGRKAGVNIKEIRLGEPAIPPELLVSRLREQLARQLSRAYREERKAQQTRLETERARATADEQPRLVKADIDVSVSERLMLTARNEGAANRAFLEEQAEGQRAQVDVLGEDRVMTLEMIKQVLQALSQKPELVQLVERLVPHTVVSGENGHGLAGAAALLGEALRPKPTE